METLANLRDYVRDELGPDLGASSFITDADIDRYLNDGLRRLEYHREVRADLAWAAGAEQVALPADFLMEDRIIPDDGSRLPPHKVWAGNLEFTEPMGAVSAGGAKLYYYASWPVLTGSQGTLLPGTGDQALVAWACYRFFKRLASSRADYRRYSTLLQGNGVDMDELSAISDQYYAEFLDAREGLPARSPSTFYGD